MSIRALLIEWHGWRRPGFARVLGERVLVLGFVSLALLRRSFLGRVREMRDALRRWRTGTGP